jgi:hypothetical protein
VISLGLEIGPKRPEILHELIPIATGVGLLVNRPNPANFGPIRTDLQTAARTLGLQLHVLQASVERDFDEVFAILVQLRVGGLVIGADRFFTGRSEQLRYAMPAIYEEKGGLLGYPSKSPARLAGRRVLPTYPPVFAASGPASLGVPAIPHHHPQIPRCVDQPPRATNCGPVLGRQRQMVGMTGRRGVLEGERLTALAELLFVLCGKFLLTMSHRGWLPRLYSRETKGMRVIMAWISGINLGSQWVDRAGGSRRLVRCRARRFAERPVQPTHFVRAIGGAYVFASACRCGSQSTAARERVQAGAAFPTLHELVHLWDVAAGRQHPAVLRSPDHFCAAVRGDLDHLVFAPRGPTSRGQSTMIKRLMQRWIDKFEHTWNYDASFFSDMLNADPRALLAFSKVLALGAYRKDVPPAAYCAAGIAGTMSEDCGPCTQLVIDMAQRKGVDPVILRAIVARDVSAMPDNVGLAVRFTEASLNHAPEAKDLRDEVVCRFGKRGLVLLAFAMTAARLYPTLKYALAQLPDFTRRTPLISMA